ncbi:MAG TPA: DUF1573 domain-containing protein [Pirellulaceae bacterium]|nr:DUF1573 domain-containing protein [Pirellulaceae bacterium]
MKTVILAAVFLAIGISLGIWTASRTFVGETLPTKPFVAYFEQLKVPEGGHEGPRLQVVGGETHDFGSLPLWAKRKHTFVVRNSGNQTLKLVMGKPSCDCASGEDLKQGDLLEIAPGQQRDIVLKWEIRSSNPQFAQSAPFRTNDKKRPSLVLAIVGQVEDAVRRSREIVTFTNVPASASVIESVRLETNQTDKLSIVGDRFLNPDTSGFFEVQFEPPTAEEAKEAFSRSMLMARITLKPGLPLGPFQQTLELTTNMAPAVPPLQIPIKGNIVGDILVFGPGVRTHARTVTLGVIPYGRGATRTVTVSVKGPQRHETTLSVKELVPPYLKVQVGKPDDSKPNVRLCPVTIEVPQDAPLDNLGGGGEGGRAGRIVLETTHPTIKQIELTVFYVVRNTE